MTLPVVLIVICMVVFGPELSWGHCEEKTRNPVMDVSLNVRPLFLSNLPIDTPPLRDDFCLREQSPWGKVGQALRNSTGVIVASSTSKPVFPPCRNRVLPPESKNSNPLPPGMERCRDIRKRQTSKSGILTLSRYSEDDQHRCYNGHFAKLQCKVLRFFCEKNI